MQFASKSFIPLNQALRFVIMGNLTSKSNDAQMSFRHCMLLRCMAFSRFLRSLANPWPWPLFLTPAASGSENVDAVDATAERDEMEVVAEMGATAAPAAASPPIPPHSLRRQPTPEEAERYAEVARQLNEVARQIEAEYSSDLDQLVDSLNLVSEMAYDAFAGDDRMADRGWD